MYTRTHLIRSESDFIHTSVHISTSVCVCACVCVCVCVCLCVPKTTVMAHACEINTTEAVH